MRLALVGIAVVLLGVAIVVQVYYLRALTRSGHDVPRATRVISYLNITLLAVLALGLIVFGLSGRLNVTGG